MNGPASQRSTAAAVITRPRLPAPASTRWQPLRLGLVNLYRFDDEVFAFEDGRLLLRGNNGTGKSRVLALTIPFLFDGQVDPNRVEPDGDQAKRMEWNLLMGRHDDRLGYAWLEFGRRVEPADGVGEPDERFVTLGCGLRATAGRGAPRTWFFVTDRRVGDDLRLIAETGQALTRDRLAEAVGDRGEVVETATEYRRLVDRALFGLGEYRYEALLHLLIQLRRPQLSRQLDESLLSDALSEALPPLPPAVIADVAEAFRALDDDRDRLEGFQAALAATDTFLSSYRGYAAVAAHRRATAVTHANSRYERTRAELRDAERAHEHANAEVDRLEEKRDELLDSLRMARTVVRTLETSPEMEAVRELDRARERANETAAYADARAEDLERAEREMARYAAKLEDADGAATASRADVSDATERARTAAETTGIERGHTHALEPLALPDGRDGEALDRAGATLDEIVERTRRAAEHLRDLDDAVHEIVAELASARERMDERSAELDRARDAAGDAEQALEAAREEAVAALRDWAAKLRVLGPIHVDEIADEVHGWDGGAPGPIAAAVDRAAIAARKRLAREAAALESEIETVAAERTETAGDRQAVADGAPLPPPASHTRDPAARDARPGAPFWRLVDLREGVAEADAAGYEAALEASGLLDAWVTPDGELLDADDTVLVAAGTPPREDDGLRGVLEPAIPPDDPRAASVEPDHVRALLARIGARTDGDVWVAADGRWRVGPLRGRWRKEDAEHIGPAARERARGRRLADLDARLAELDARWADLERRRAALEAHGATAEDERATAPDEDGVREAIFAARHAAEEVRHRAQRMEEAEAIVGAHRERLERAKAERDQAAADVGFPDRAADPGGLLADLERYRGAVTELWAKVEIHADRLRALDAATADRDRTEAECDRQRRQASEARHAAAEAATRRDTIERTIDRTPDEILARLDVAREHRDRVEAELEEVRHDRERQIEARARSGAKVEDAHGRLEEHTAARAHEVERFRRLVQAGLLDVAGVDADADPPADDDSWAPDPAVRAARRVNDALDSTAADEADWDRVQHGLHERFTALEQKLLPHALQPSLAFDDELFIVTTSFQGRTASMPELRALLEDEVLARQSVLDAREREVLENHLVGEVATQLHELIRNGEALVTDVNEELAARPTSTGMRLRFSWRPRDDGPEMFADARRRLLAADHVWSPEDREALGAFLHARIREVRDADDTGTWQEHLTQALDYRRWHIFAVERRQEGNWVRLTRRTHGTGSGGEKALALTIPQFAAVAAHYRSANDESPRLIALDEAFVGIDNDMRAKCMDLLVNFDLDVAMTSEREWACYPTVPAIAIYQLATRPGVDAVGVHRWVWNGRDRLEVEDEREEAM